MLLPLSSLEPTSPPPQPSADSLVEVQADAEPVAANLEEEQGQLEISKDTLDVTTKPAESSPTQN
jgi:hypothetical protein